MKNILIIGNYGATNLGDEAILRSILQRTHGVADSIVISSNPKQTAKIFEVESVPMIPAGLRSFRSAISEGTLKKTLRCYKKADVIVFGGGGLLSDEKPVAMFIWLMQILPAFWYRKPAVCYGQSIGPLQRGWSKKIVKFIFKRLRKITVRDEASEKILAHLGIHNVRILPDPVFGLHVGKSIKMKTAGHDYIVFSLRHWINSSKEKHQTLASFIDWIFEKYGLTTLFVPFQQHQDDDSAEMLQVISLLKHREAAELLSYNENIYEVMELIACSKAVIGMRLHALIFSVLMHRPFLALSYSQKVSEVVHQLGMEDYLVSFNSFHLQDLQAKFSALMEKDEHVEKALTSMHKEFAEKTKSYSDLI